MMVDKFEQGFDVCQGKRLSLCLTCFCMTNEHWKQTNVHLQNVVCMFSSWLCGMWSFDRVSSLLRCVQIIIRAA